MHGLREGPLSDDAVSRFIADNCVPVALNLYVVRKAKGLGGDFFRNVQKQRPAQYQGLYLVRPEGKVLASHQNFKSHKTWPRELLADLQPGLRAFGEVKPRNARLVDPLPERGVGAPKDRGACLAVFLRYSIKGIPLRELPNPTIDSLVLTAGELAELAPAKVEAGAAWKLSEALGRKFCRVLGPGDENTMPRPNEVKSVRFVGKVKSVVGGIAQVTYEGEIAGSHETQSNRGKCHGKAQLTGVGTYDAKAGRLLSLVWVFEGTFIAPPRYDKPARSYSGVVEWRQERAGRAAAFTPAGSPPAARSPR